MTKIVRLISYIILGAFFTSCSSNQVVSSHIFQKRKYTGGFYFAGNKHHLNQSGSLQKTHEQVLKNERTIASNAFNAQTINLDDTPIETTKEIFTKIETENHVVRQKPNNTSKRVNLSMDNEMAKRPDSHLSSPKIARFNDDEGGVSPKATISFFASIFGWLLLIGIIPAAILGLWLVVLAFILMSLILEAVAYFLSDDEKVKSAEIANIISGYYWYFMGTMLTVTLGSILFYL